MGKIHDLSLDGILQIANLSSLGTEPDYFPTLQPFLWNSNLKVAI